MTDDLVTFLKARLDEAEQDARSAAGDERHQQWAMHESPDYNEGYIVSDALWHLADIGAKRRIVDQYGAAVSDPVSYSYEARMLAEDVLRLLALPEAGHPDYRQEWSV